ncbi:unnamed protein product [Closterium sp. Naga37s-1]|nr:unnamed protein product [Closterium sp. Naga37s-1]
MSVGGKSNGESATRRQSTEAASREAQSPTRDGPRILGLGERISGSGRKREQAEPSPLDGLQLRGGGGGCGGQGFSFSPVGNPEGHQKRQETNPRGCADGVTAGNVTIGVGSRGDGQYNGGRLLGGEDARGVIETRPSGFVREEREKESSKGDERENEREGEEAARDEVKRGRERGWEGWEKMVGAGDELCPHDQQQQQQQQPSQNVSGGDAHRHVEYRVTACEEGRRPPAWKPAGFAGHLKPDDDLTLKAFLKGGKRRPGVSAVRGAQTWRADKIADAWRKAEGLAEMERVRREQAGRGAHPTSGSANPLVTTTAATVCSIQRFPAAGSPAAFFSPYASGGAAVKDSAAPEGRLARSDSARKGKAAVADEPFAPGFGFERCASSECTGGSSQGESSRSRGGGKARGQGKRRKGSRLSGGGERKGKVKTAGAAAGDAAIGADVTAPTDLSTGGKASAQGAKSGGGREKRGVDARADVAGKGAAQQSEKAKQMERNLKVASAQLLTLQKWDEGSRDLAVRWAVWLLRLIRKSAPTPPPPSIRLLLFSSILMTLPRIADSLLPLTSLPGLAYSPASASAGGSVKGLAGGSAVSEVVRQMLRSVCALVGAVGRSQVCFSPLHWEILQEPLDRCRSLHASVSRATAHAKPTPSAAAAAGAAPAAAVAVPATAVKPAAAVDVSTARAAATAPAVAAAAAAAAASEVAGAMAPMTVQQRPKQGHHGLDLALSAPAEAAAARAPATPASLAAASAVNPLAHQPAPPLNAHSHRAFGSAQRRRQRAVEQQAKELCSGLFSPYGRQAVSGSGASSKRSDGPAPPLPPPHVTATAAAAAAAAASPSPSASAPAAAAAASSGRMPRATTTSTKDASGHKSTAARAGAAAHAGTSVWLGTPLAAGIGAKIAVGGRGSASAVYRELSSRCGSSGGWKSGGEGSVGEEGMEEGESVREVSVGAGGAKRVREGEAGGYAEWSARNVAQTEATAAAADAKDGDCSIGAGASVGATAANGSSSAGQGTEIKIEMDVNGCDDAAATATATATGEEAWEGGLDPAVAAKVASLSSLFSSRYSSPPLSPSLSPSASPFPFPVPNCGPTRPSLSALGSAYTYTGCTSGHTWVQEGGEGSHMVSRPRSRKKKMAKRE